MDEARTSAERAGGATAEALSPAEEFAEYLPHIRRRWEAQQAALAQRQAEAWAAARRAAAILRTRFGAETVIAFGSLVHPGRFSDRSDIDLAVTGIPAVRFFKVWAAAMEDCPFEMDLVDLALCPQGLWATIDRAGVPT